jgi:ribulose-phosphate 3-epimerase
VAAVLAPSILSADFSCLGDQLRAAEAGGASVVHVDVMDGHFVPNITIGPLVTAAVRRVTELPIDCHLMIERPERFIDAFVEAGADMVSVHVEADRHVHRTVGRIRDLGAKAGVVLNPATPLQAIEELVPVVDYVLMMSVNPGLGGQRFIPQVLNKVRTLRERIDRERLDVRIEIDGGVSLDNLEEVAAAGVDIVVAGSAVFGADDPRAAAEALVRRLAEVAERARRC